VKTQLGSKMGVDGQVINRHLAAELRLSSTFNQQTVLPESALPQTRPQVHEPPEKAIVECCTNARQLLLRCSPEYNEKPK
jgi:hypothetical protein